MTARKLRLGSLPKTASTKLTFTCPASLKANLDRYAALHAQTYGETVDAVTLIPHMLEAFMAGDRGIQKGRSGTQHAAQIDLMTSIHHAAPQNAQITTAHLAFWIPRSLSDYDSDTGLMANATIQPAPTRYRFLSRCSYLAPSLRSRSLE